MVAILVLASTFTVIANVEEQEEITSTGWVNSAGGTGFEAISGLVKLSDSRIVIGGSFTGTMFFDDNGIVATGPDISFDENIYLAILDSNGTWINYSSFGSNGSDGIDNIALHTSGDLIISGHFCKGTVGLDCTFEFFEGHSYDKESIAHDGSAFVGRFSITGNEITPIWIRQLNNPSERLSPSEMSVSNNGEIAIGVYHVGTLTVLNESISTDLQLGLAVINFDENGALQWANGIYGLDSLLPFGALCHDENNYLYATGTFSQELIVPELLSAEGENDIFVLQLDIVGNATWITSAGGPGEDWVTDCAVDSNNYIRLVGQFESNATFGTNNVTSNGWRDFFHAKLSSSGTWESIVTGGNNGWERINSIAIDARDNAYLTGQYSRTFTLGQDELPEYDTDWELPDIFVAQLDSNEQWSWALSAGGAGEDKGQIIVLDEFDNPLVASIFSKESTFSNQTFDSYGRTDVAIWLYARDFDNDGYTDGVDNCPRDSNPNQFDSDGDLWGDACDDDDDNDGVGDEWDECSPGETGWYANSNTDHDSDGCQDNSEDFDDDEDGILDQYDDCKKGPVGWVSTIENDEDQNGCEDLDSDGDGWVDQLDICPSISDDQADLDNDGIGDACEDDTDGDGIADVIDQCMRDNFNWTSDHSQDHDQDGCRDEDRDTDDDNDGVLDFTDNCPLGEINWYDENLSQMLDHDSDGCKDDTEDSDDDEDTYSDDIDNCPKGIVGPAGTGMDLDQDGCIDSAEDDDDDEDGISDQDDDCKYTPKGAKVDEKGCSGSELDDDNDGITNNIDLCPSSMAGVPVSSTGCELNNEVKNSEESTEESSILVQILFIISGLLIVAALYTNFGSKSSSEGSSAKGKKLASLVDNGGSQGQSAPASSDVDNSSLDSD